MAFAQYKRGRTTRCGGYIVMHLIFDGKEHDTISDSSYLQITQRDAS
jgi:hypothetical protein